MYGKHGTDHIADHLRVKHRVTKTGQVNSEASVLEQQQRGSTISSLISRVNYDAFRTTLIHWIVCMHIPFSIVENTFFRAFLATISASVGSLLPLDGDTIRKWIMGEFQRKKVEIKQSLHTSKSLIHFSFDLWTSPNALAMLGVVAHYMDNMGKNRTVLLGLRRLRGPHSGENMAQLIIEIIMEYDVVDKIGYFVLDNASSNDTCVRVVLQRLRPDLNPIHRRLRCLGHVLNLGAKTFLFGQETEAFEAEITLQQALEDDIKELQLWRKRGAVEKLHNIVTFIRRTPQRREAFENLISLDTLALDNFQNLQLVADNATRWNSLYRMIQRAIQLKNQVDYFLIQHSASSHSSSRPGSEEERALKHDLLTPEDWLLLVEMLEILKPFETLTTRMEGYGLKGERGCVWEYLTSLEFLMTKLEEKKQSYNALVNNPDLCTPENRHLEVCITNAWMKINEYYSRLDQSPIYYAACVTNPRLKWAWFESSWKEKPAWILHGKEILNSLWLSEYKGQNLSSSMDVNMTLNKSDPDEFDQFVMMPDNLTIEKSDSLEIYLRDNPIPDIKNLLEHWQSPESLYPDLSQLAYDTCSIPAMSAECERVFSSTKLLITDRRNRLKEDIIEASEVLKSWLYQGKCEFYNCLFIATISVLISLRSRNSHPPPLRQPPLGPWHGGPPGGLGDSEH